ncbi:MFS transporter [Pseudomonas sp. S60]|uniref:MFS transporter n=1 Tax=Pseudomonas sp. S60 TaxID=211124 RepID=UPI00191462AC|nr:MFS transporter [Pseudomonas sp. S60]MBK5009753.1 MFS transporter [Pseudomonas sp. S60]
MSTKLSGRDLLFNAAVCLGFVIVQLDVSIVNVGLEALRQSYNASIADLEWVINSYSLVFAALLLSSGQLGERFGVRNIFISGVTIFTIASLGCALAPSILWLDISRGIQGLGGALLVPSSLTLIRKYYSDNARRGLAVGLWATSGGLALAAGPVIGGALIGLFGWQSIFLVNIPLGLMCIVFALRYAPSGKGIQQRLNIPGQTLIVSTLGLLAFGLTEAGNGLRNSTPLISIAVGILMLGIFVASEKRSSAPVLAPSVMKNRTIVSALIIGSICSLMFYGAVFIMSIFFQTKLRLSSFEAGLSFLPMMICTTLVVFNSTRLAKRFSSKTLAIAGSIISLTGFTLLLFINANWTVWQFFIPMMVLGSGTSIAAPAMTNLILSEAGHQDAGSASAIFAFARQAGGVTGVAVFGLMLNTIGSDDLILGLKAVAGTSISLTLAWLYISKVKLQITSKHT